MDGKISQKEETDFVGHIEIHGFSSCGACRISSENILEADKSWCITKQIAVERNAERIQMLRR